MKKKGIIIIFLVIFLIVFAFFSSDIGSNYLINYGRNFKNNLNSVTKTLGISLPKDWQEFLDSATEEQPQTEYDVLKQEYEKQQKEEQEALDKQKELDDAEYESTNIKHSGKNIALQNASSSRFARFSNGVLCASETSLTLYTPQGNVKWSHPLQISSPVLKTSENYILLFEKNGEKFSLYNGSKNIYSKSISGTIKTASVSSTGDVCIVFDRENYKGSVCVYNKSGDAVYLWNSGTYSITDAAMSSSRRLAVSLLDAANLSSKVYFFDISKSDTDKNIDLKDSIVFDIEFDANTLNAFSDNKIFGISSNAKLKWTYDATQKKITKYSATDGGTKLVAFDNNNSSEITIISSSGKEKSVIKSDVLPDFVDIYGEKILYNEERTLILSKLSGDAIIKYPCSRDIKRAYIIDANNIFIVYNSSIEFLNIQGE